MRKILLKNYMKFFYIFILSFFIYFLVHRNQQAVHPQLPQVKIGYIHTGRTAILNRALKSKAFQEEGISVSLLIKKSGEKEYSSLLQNPDSSEETEIKQRGHLQGAELIDLVVKGKFDGATLSETAFIQSIEQGQPIVAVAELGHDVKGHSGHGLVLRDNITLSDPASFKGLRFGARRSAGGNEIMLREFLSVSGVDPDKGVRINANIEDDDKLGKMLQDNLLDGAFTNQAALLKWTEEKYPVKMFRTLDWVNPEVGQSLLVFSKSFYKNNPEAVKKVIRAYMKRILKESNTKNESPQFEKVPVVRQALLNEWQDLLIKHKASKKKIDLMPFIDNSIVLSLASELYKS